VIFATASHMMLVKQAVVEDYQILDGENKDKLIFAR
jgi:hypothetical protein